MDACEATRIVLSRIKNLDSENASKIMGLLLIQGYGEKEMIRLAFSPENLVHSIVLKARKELGLASNSPSTPSSPFNSASSRLLGGVGGSNLPSPLSNPSQCSLSSSSWANFSDFSSSDDLISPNSASGNGITNITSSSSMNSSAPPFYAAGATDLVDEFQLHDQLSFLNDGSSKSPDLFYTHQDLASSPGGDALLFPSYGLSHRRSCSVNDISSDDGGCGFGWRPCVYYARGFCKNGANCRFLHDSPAMAGLDGASSPGKLDMMEQCQELLRSKSLQQQRPSTIPYSAIGSNKCLNFLLQQQTDTQRAAAALMMGEEVQKFGRSRLERGELSINGGPGMVNPGSRQIYLTFPADSTFREEDVSNYFSIYGPVQDVRIPYQQKRMFGFVTFVYPETVKLILAKGNPHFVCDARVLVKPYKEKGKVPDKYRKQQQLQQQMERGEFLSCGSPTGGLDSRDPCDLQLGGRMFCSGQDMLWRRKLEEQADLQQAIELQGRRFLNLQLLDVKRNTHHRTLSLGAAISSPTLSPNFFHQNPESIKESKPSIPAGAAAPASDGQSQQSEKEKERENNGTDAIGVAPEHQQENSAFSEGFEHNLPDSPFASPKATGERLRAFSGSAGESEKKAAAIASAKTSLIASSLLPATSTLDMASLNSCYFQVPRFGAGPGAIGMGASFLSLQE